MCFSLTTYSQPGLGKLFVGFAWAFCILFPRLHVTFHKLLVGFVDCISRFNKFIQILFSPFNVWKDGEHSSIACETNILNAATLYVRILTSLGFIRHISIRAWILSRFISMPWWFTMTKNFLGMIPKVHFSRFSFIKYF